MQLSYQLWSGLIVTLQANSNLLEQLTEGSPFALQTADKLCETNRQLMAQLGELSNAQKD